MSILKLVELQSLVVKFANFVLRMELNCYH